MFMPKTKIICTLGPSSNTETLIRKMMLYGMDVARLNFSHGNHNEHLNRLRIVRALNAKRRRHIRILQDLEGYRIRVGHLEKPLYLEEREIYYLSKPDYKQDEKTIPFDYTGSLRAIKKGRLIYIDDGKIILKVLISQNNLLKTKVIIPGVLLSRKGVNIPGFIFEAESLTSKDKIDLEFAFQYKPDYIAQSFVRNHKDVLALRCFIKDKLPKVKIIAKIENHQGIANIDKIIECSDLIMIARGDLGVSCPIYKVPIVQKQIIKKCRSARKKVIVATQMLESMNEHFIPTRAEVSDVANAILDGTDFVMLSSETAKGKYPAECVRLMNEIIKYTEKHRLFP